MGSGLHRQLLSRPCSDKAKSIAASSLKAAVWGHDAGACPTMLLRRRRVYEPLILSDVGRASQALQLYGSDML